MAEMTPDFKALHEELTKLEGAANEAPFIIAHDKLTIGKRDTLDGRTMAEIAHCREVIGAPFIRVDGKANAALLVCLRNNTQTLLAALELAQQVDEQLPFDRIALLEAENASLKAQLKESRELAERLKREAQGHAQASRTADATLNEIYQLCSEGKGEKANWNGAEPVRQKLAALQEQLAAKERESS